MVYRRPELISAKVTSVPACAVLWGSGRGGRSDELCEASPQVVALRPSTMEPATIIQCMPEQRKLVSVLFADVVGSTALASDRDPEVVRAVMGRYFERMKAIAEEHGGTVEKFAGDAVMVVFGVPRVHDDDAERAVRAALAMRSAVAQLGSGLQCRIAVNSGEAVTGAGNQREFMVSGDVVNVAARLQQAAEPGEVLAGDATHSMTAAAIRYGPGRLVEARGKPQPLLVHPALEAGSMVPEQHRGLPGLQAPLIGRERELRLFQETFGRVTQERAPHVFTVIGGPGVGKSRLVAEALGRLHETGVRVLRGRCLPYGSGITYWPLAEILRQDAAITFEDGREKAVEKLDLRLQELGVGADVRPVRARAAVIMGLAEPAEALPDVGSDRLTRELAWGFRRCLELLTRAGDLLLVFDDLQWAEDPVVETIQLVADRVTETPLMIVCIARPEFVEQHAGWGGGRLNFTSLALSPLSAVDTGTLISNLLDVEELPEALKAQVVQRSEGVPLYCEEFLRMLLDERRIVREGDRWRAAGEINDIVVPLSIQGLLAARLDGLAADEKAAVQAASVVGERFSASDLVALLPDAGEPLERLLRKGLVVEDRESLEGFRFRHLLLRDAAYNSLPKAERARLHELFGERLGSGAGDPDQLAQIIAYHAERAFILSRELMLGDEEMERRARRALRWGLALGKRASGFRDHDALAAACATVRAALEVVHDGDEEGLRLNLLEARVHLFRTDYVRAGELLRAARDAALAAGSIDLAAAAQVDLVEIEIFAGELEDLAREEALGMRLCEKAGDESGLLRMKMNVALDNWAAGQLRVFREQCEEIAQRALQIGLAAVAADALGWSGGAAAHLGEPDAALTYLQRSIELAESGGFRRHARRSRIWLKGVQADLGEVEPYLQACREAADEALEDGDQQPALGSLRRLAERLLQERRIEEAARVLEQALGLAIETGDRWNRSELFAMKALVTLSLGDAVLAEELADKALAWLRGEEDRTAVAFAHRVLGIVKAALGNDSEAEAALRKALDVDRSMEFRLGTTESELALARFLAERGKQQEAAELIESAAGFAQRSGYRRWDAEMAEMRGLIASGHGGR